MSNVHRFVPASPIKTAKWYAWINHHPSQSAAFHVVGEVEVPHPRIEPILSPIDPDAENSRRLRLELTLVELPGEPLTSTTVKSTRFDRQGGVFERVEIYCGAELIVDVQVESV